jgi:hypothetical protein
MNAASKLGPHTHTHTHEQRDESRCEALSLLQRPLLVVHCRGIHGIRVQLFSSGPLARLFPAPAIWFARILGRKS